MKIQLEKLMAFAFVSMVVVFLIAYNLNKPRVFILHSYDTDYSWVTDINEGFARVLKNKAYNTLLLHEYQAQSGR